MNYDSLITQYSEVDELQHFSVENQLELIGYYLREKHWVFDGNDHESVGLLFSTDIANLLIRLTFKNYTDYPPTPTSESYERLGITLLELIRELFWEPINNNICNKHGEFIENRNREIDKQKSVIPPPQMSFGRPDYDKIGKYVCDVLKDMKIIQ